MKKKFFKNVAVTALAISTVVGGFGVMPAVNAEKVTVDAEGVLNDGYETYTFNDFDGLSQKYENDFDSDGYAECQYLGHDFQYQSNCFDLILPIQSDCFDKIVEVGVNGEWEEINNVERVVVSSEIDLNALTYNGTEVKIAYPNCPINKEYQNYLIVKIWKQNSPELFAKIEKGGTISARVKIGKLNTTYKIYEAGEKANYCTEGSLIFDSQGKVYTVLPKAPVRDGYEFEGYVIWGDEYSTDDGKTFKRVTNVMNTENLEKPDTKILLMPGNMLGGYCRISARYKKSITAVPTVQPTQAPTAVPTVQPTQAPTAVPIQTPNLVQVIYTANGGSFADGRIIKNESYPAGSVQVISSKDFPSKAGSVFDGFSVVNGTIAYDALNNAYIYIVPANGNDVLTAQWKSIETPAPAATQTPEPVPTVAPTAAPTAEPTVAPTVAPTAEPTAEPTVAPTVAPADTAAPAETSSPTQLPDVQTELALNKDFLKLGAGDKYTLKATTDAENAGIAFRSSDSSVAYVDENGRITAKKAGKAVIAASVNGVEKTCTVTVMNAPNKKTLKLSAQSKTLRKGKSYVLKVSFAEGTYCRAISLTSSNKKVASVSGSGKIKALRKGSASIVVRTSTGFKRTVKIKVIK